MISLGIITTRKPLSQQQLNIIHAIVNGFATPTVHIGDNFVFRRPLLAFLNKANIPKVIIHPSHNYSVEHVPINLTTVAYDIRTPLTVDAAYKQLVDACNRIAFFTYKKTDLIQGEIIKALRYAREFPEKECMIVDYKGHVRYGASNQPSR